VLAFFTLALAGRAEPGRSSEKTAVQSPSQRFPTFLSRNFDYAAFTRFDAEAPPKNRIFQSNGFLALEEGNFAKQIVLIPAPVDEAPTNTGDRLLAMEIDAPVFTNTSGKTYNFTDSPASRHITYFADRTVYRAAFDGGPEVSFTVYPVYGKPAAVLRTKVEKAHGPLSVTLHSRGKVFEKLGATREQTLCYGSPRWPYRLLMSAVGEVELEEEGFEWTLRRGDEASVTLVLGGTEEEAEATLNELKNSHDLFDDATHKAWNDYLRSVPLVAPAEPIRFKVGTTGEERTITPEDLVRSELWTWRGVLTDTSQVRYLTGSPLVIADWLNFVGMWGNDGIAEALSLAATGRKEIAHTSILNWFRYSVNAAGDGTAAWTIFPSGRNTFAAKGAERETQSVPLQAALVGQYVRLTGDFGILNEKPGGAAKDRTVWQSLVAYQQNLLKVRDINQDHLIDWTHTFETGWDDKNAPFVDRNGAPTTTVNEQVCNLWSLEEMVYLSKLRGEDATPWQEEFETVRNAVHTKLWDAETQRYWDLDVRIGRLWTQGENLDAYDFLYYENDQSRVAAMMKRFADPKKFNGALLPTLAFDTPNWGGYWRGPSWPREYAQVTLALSHAGYGREAFTWLARGLNTNLGPVIPENINPKTYPAKQEFSGVRIMGYTGLDCLAFPDVAGLRIWAGKDLTVAADAALGRVYVRGQKWMGDSFDALFEPTRPTRIWRNGREMKALPANQTWRATKNGRKVSFKPIQANSSHRLPISTAQPSVLGRLRSHGSETRSVSLDGHMK